MKRWLWKRWAWVIVVGVSAAVGTVLAEAGKDNKAWPPKVGDSITLPFESGPKQVKVLKTDKQDDGSYLCEVKDVKSGETFNLLERPPGNTPQLPGAAQPGRPSDPMLPSVKDAMAGMGKDKAKEPEKGRLVPSLTGTSKDKTTTSQKPDPEPEEKPGLLKRIFGRKKSEPSSAAMPAATTGRPSSPAAVPAVRPTPGTTGEPPRSQPNRSVEQPTPVIPTPAAPPAAPPASVPIPVPLPSAPALPQGGPPNTGGLPPIPLPPGGVSSAMPMTGSAVMPASRTVTTPSVPAMHPDVRADAGALQAALAPSARALAARALCGGRHGTTADVKRCVFEAAQRDPCPTVRAVCIEELCKLGYSAPAFMAFCAKACDDKSDEVKAAAKAAMAQLTPRR